MNRLTDALKRRLQRDGFLLVPKHISWRRASQMQNAGIGTIYPFHERWLGRFDITPAGRAALAQEGGRDGE